ncbi:MAG: hypothetical protein WA140_12840 [Geobacteraceae bacterium]
MAQWTDRFKNHPIWNYLQNLGPAIDDALKREGTEPQSIEGLARLKAVLAFTGQRLAGADPFIINFGTLDNLGNQFQSIVQEIQNFTANGNVGHITNANTNADTALNILAQLNVLLTTEDFISAKEAAEAYRIGLDNVLSELRNSSGQLQKDLDALKARSSELTAEINSEKARLGTVSTDFQTKFVADQESRSKEFAAAQKDQQDQDSALRTEFKQVSADLQTKFLADQESISTEFIKNKKEQQEQYSALISEFKEKLSTQNSDFTKQGAEIVRTHEEELEALKEEFVEAATKLRDEITERKAEVEKLVGVIGNLGVTSGYLITANKAKTTLIVWQGITVGALIGLIVIAVVAFLPAIGGSFSWGSFAGRVFISLTFGVLAAYAASQADKYQKVEQQNRRLALELEAIGPFIAPLPTEKQEEFRMTIGERSFGHGNGVHGGIDTKSPATLVDLLMQTKESKEFRALLTDIIKAVK